MADAGTAKSEPEKISWADVEEEEEAKAEADLTAAAPSSSAPVDLVVDAQAKQIEALLLSVPDDDGGDGPPLLDDSDDSQIQVTSGDTVYESSTASRLVGVPQPAPWYSFDLSGGRDSTPVPKR